MKDQSKEISRAVRRRALGSLSRKRSDNILNLVLIVVLVILSTITIRGQQGNIAYPENAIDSRLRTSMKVDPTSGALQFQINLGNYPGRAGAGLPIVLYYSSKVWQLEHLSTIGGCDQWQNCYPQESDYNAYFAEQSASGWTSNLDWFIWPSGSSTQLYDSEGRPANIGTSRVARMFVRLPDGSKHELRRDDNVWAASGFNGNGVYYAVDGSRLRYHTDTGTLWLPDGSRYVGNLQYIDRHGNTLNYTNATRQWTDTLGRPITVPLPAFSTTGEQYSASARDEYYSIPGVGGASLTYTFKWRYLTDVRTDPSQALRPKGDRVNTYNCQRVPSLFTSPSPCGGLDEDHRIIASTAFNPVLLHQIVFPNGSTYTFTYNIYGEIDKIVHPTGGYEKFTYDLAPELSAHFMTDQIWNFYAGGNRGVREQRISWDGTPGSEVLWQYTLGPINWTTAPDGTRTEGRVHQSQGQYIAHGFDDPRAGLAYDERIWAPNSGPMLRRKLTEWLVDGTAQYFGWRLQYKTRNPRPAKEVEIILDTGGNALAATTTYQYDADLNLISTQRYAFVEVDQSTAQTGAITSIPLGSLIRTEETDYLTNNQAYRDRNMLALPTATRIKNPAGTIISQSQTLYDEAAYPLLTCGASTGWGDPATSARGNATTGKFWLNTTGTWIEAHTQFDQCGSVRKSWDGKGNVSEVQYASAYQFAYPTTSLSPIPDPTGQTGSNTSLISSTSYDFSTGLITSTTDHNNQVTSFSYNDPLNRLKQFIRPSGGGSTTYDYGDSPGNLYVRGQTSLDTTRVVESYKYFDGLGRPQRTFLNEGGGNYLVTDTQYDSLGRVWRVSNPYRTAILNGAINPSGVWTTTAYDPLGRVLTVTTPDNAVVTTGYSGNTVTVTDQTGKKRKIVTDALGRLKEVYEDPTGLNYLTSYSYDALDNLTTVTQGTQTRTFVYDSLKRLTSATNPESGTVTYSYDNNSNLLTKTDARSITSTYTYDALNRNTQVDYSDATPDILRQYDQAINGKGRLNQAWQTGTTTSATYIDSYDALGRPLIQRQRFETNGVWSSSYQVSRAYNLAGAVTSQTYPSGRTVSYSYDNAGRTYGFTGNLGDGVQRTYAAGISYSSFGSLVLEQFGTDTPLYHKLQYNMRGQLWDIRVSTGADVNGSWNRGALQFFYDSSYGYGSSGPDNNGNVLKSWHYVPLDEQASTWAIQRDSYSYDALNRITSVAEHYIASGQAETQQFLQSYSYDRYGNRTIDAANTWGTGINNSQFTVNTANNRLGVPGGQSGVMSYDDAGNLTTDTYTGAGSRTYDAENRMTQAVGGTQGGTQYYTYNGDGQRTRRKVDGVETWQIYGLEGELLAEYAANAAAASPQKEYGYRNGQLLITAEPGAATSGPQNVTWTSVAPTIQVSGNSLQKVSGTSSWYDAGAVSTQAIPSGDGYVEFTPGNTVTWRMIGLGNGNSSDYFGDIEFAFYVDGGGGLHVYEAEIYRGQFGTYTSSDRLRVAVEGGVVKYRKNGALVYTSTVAPVYPLLVDTSLNTVNSELINVVISGGGGTGSDIKWLVADQLGTPRIIIDKTGSLASVKRHDYLPFGEELYAGTGGRTTQQGYTGDNVRQKFTQKERDNETGLDYFLARYYSAVQGRFTSPDEFTGGPIELYYFVSDAAANPTFYADLINPQSLNKYQYTYNNPLRYTDPDGHCPACPVAQRIVQSPTGQQVINAAGAAATTTVVVASGALKKAWEWFTTPNPNFKGKTVCGMGLDCSGAYKNQYLNKSNEQNAANPNQQGQGQSNTASPNPNDPDKKPVFGERGTQTTSTTVGKGQGWRVDVENPNPGQRPGQIHYQSGDKKYLYDANTKSFVGVSKTENKRLLNDAQVQRAITKGLKVLGEN